MRPLGFAIKEWMEVYKKNEVKESTYNRLLITYRIMLNYGICNVPVVSVTTLDVQRYINKLVNAGYARTTILKQYRLLTAYFSFAAREQLIGISPVLSVSIPKEAVVKKKRKSVEAYTVPQQKALMQIFDTRQHREYDVASIMLETGCRVGEVLALTWNDIDWNRKAVRISKTVIRLNGGKWKVQPSPKSESSNRTIPLSTRAWAIMQRLYNDAEDTNGYIFTGEENEILTYNAVKYHIKKACEMAKVPYTGTHAFRHTFATNCYHRGCDVKLLSRMLGHASAAITYNVYIHLYGDALEEMRNVVG